MIARVRAPIAFQGKSIEVHTRVSQFVFVVKIGYVNSFRAYLDLVGYLEQPVIVAVDVKIGKLRLRIVKPEFTAEIIDGLIPDKGVVLMIGDKAEGLCLAFWWIQKGLVRR